MFFDYYNTEHRHSGIGLLTPATVHYGLAEKVLATRQRTLLTAYRAHPERFVRRAPQPPHLPREAWINPPVKKTTSQDGAQSTIANPGNPWVLPGSGDVEDTTNHPTSGQHSPRLRQQRLLTKCKYHVSQNR